LSFDFSFNEKGIHEVTLPDLVFDRFHPRDSVQLVFEQIDAVLEPFRLFLRRIRFLNRKLFAILQHRNQDSLF
jgi:hypothetical protein